MLKRFVTMKILCLTIFFICGYCQESSNSINDLTGTKSKRERPCEIFNIDCIRKYFAHHSDCQVAYGPVPDPLIFDQTKVHFPSFNLSATLDDSYRTGLNGRIQEFYINKETDRLVLAVEFRNIGIASNRTYFTYYRRGKEPIVNMDYVRVSIGSRTATIIIPKLKNLQLRHGEVYAFYNSQDNVFEIGPNAFRGSDPGLQQAQREMIAQQKITFLEGALTDATYDIISYIQFNICDFGL